VAFAASGAKRAKNCTSSGWSQLRLQDIRITCQVGPVVGSSIQFDPPLKATARVVADCHGPAVRNSERMDNEKDLENLCRYWCLADIPTEALNVCFWG